MQIQQSSILLDNVRFHAYHGVLPQERTVGNDYLLNAEMVCDITEAVESDILSGTVNYAEAYEVIKREMLIPSNLLEHVAGRIAKALFTSFPSITEVHLTIAKLNPPFGIDGDGAKVKVHFTR